MGISPVLKRKWAWLPNNAHPIQKLFPIFIVPEDHPPFDPSDHHMV
jgi:hypothetical protein